jgi:ferritin-like protein
MIMTELDNSSLMNTPSSSETDPQPAEELATRWQKVVRRRSFLQGLSVAGATAAASLPGKKLFADENGLSKGDAALLQFALLAETLEADLWQQYNELGGAVDAQDHPNAGNGPYVNALSQIDGDMPQYISDNTDDEISHREFLKAYLKQHGVSPVDLSKFANLPSVKATGANQVGRLTNLTTLTVDTSWYFRYRSTQNPDNGAKFPQLFDIDNLPAIPLKDTYSSTTIQAIANIASIHFAFIEQGGSSLYPILALKASNLEVLRILLSIGGVEIDHFSLWHDKMGNAFQPPINVNDTGAGGTGLNFPNFNDPANQHNNQLSPVDQQAGSQMFQTNLILPEPCEFLSPNLPPCSIIRPTLSPNGGPVATIKAFTNDNLFKGQPPAFFELLQDVAAAAESAQRQMDN